MSDLAPMREQVYTDPRPKEHFDRFHERARTREPDWAYEFMRVHHLAVRLHLPARARDLRREGPRARSRDPRPQPLLLHGPLPDGLLHPPQGPLHGQVAAVQTRPCSSSTPTAACSPCAAARATKSVHHRACDPRARRRDHDVLRGRALAHGQSLRAGQARDRAAGARDRRAGRADRDLRLLARPQLEAPAVPQGDRPVRRRRSAGSRSRIPRASSSRRWPTRSSSRSAGCTPASNNTAARASCGACASSAAPSGARPKGAAVA